MDKDKKRGLSLLLLALILMAPFIFGISLHSVASDSMEPEFSRGDLLVCKKASALHTYSEGEIIVYEVGDLRVCHRIIQIQDDEVTTKGDANENPDQPINQSQIMATVLTSVPILGYVGLFLWSPKGIVTMLFIATALTAHRVSRWRIGRKFREDENEHT